MYATTVGVIFTHHELVRAGVATDLRIWDGFPHCFYLVAPDVPEAKEVFATVSQFFAENLRKRNGTFRSLRERPTALRASAAVPPRRWPARGLCESMWHCGRAYQQDASAAFFLPVGLEQSARSGQHGNVEL